MEGSSLKTKIKTAGIIILVILLGIIIFQNTDSTKLKILTWEISAPRIVLYPIIFGIGFLTGYLTHLYFQRKKLKETKAGSRADDAVKEMKKLESEIEEREAKEIEPDKKE